MNRAHYRTWNMRSAYREILRLAAFMGLFALAAAVRAQADLDINTPAIQQLTASMQQRHSQLAPHYSNGAAGFTRDGLVALRDASVIP
ncbi:MAG: hypothetical protein ACREUQ_09155, partial [Burkholderiales bacterium]